MIGHLLSGQIPVEPVASFVQQIFDALTEPIFDALATLVQVHGSGTISVVRHEIDGGALYDGEWVGLAYGFNATGTGDTRTLIPIRVRFEQAELAAASRTINIQGVLILQATDLPDRPGNSSGLDAAVTELDNAVERLRSEVDEEACAIEPVLQWAGVLRGRADQI